ncbi:MAG: extracellular solute-binding protein, partial [Clostridia bacterium]|nr:extracellular solute-binding protein [Clostridia bacterium]
MIIPEEKETLAYTAEEYTFDGVKELRKILEPDIGFMVLADTDSGCVTLDLFQDFKEQARREWNDYLFDFIWNPGGTVYSLRNDGFYETIYGKDDFLHEAKGDTLYQSSAGIAYFYQMGGRTLYMDISEVNLPEVLPGQIQTIHGMWAQGGKDYLLLSVSTEDGSADPQNTLYTVQDEKLEKVADVGFYGQHFAATEGYIFYASGGHLMKTDGTTVWNCGAFSDYLIMEDSINDILPLEDGRVVILWDDILTVLTENEEGKASANTGESQEQQKIVILQYSNYVDYRLENAINEFQRENRNYVVGIHTCSDTEALGKALVSGQFDMFMTSRGLEPIRNLVKQGYITDIRDYLGDLKDGIYPNIYEAGTIDGMVATIPFTFELKGMAIVEAAMEGRHYFESTVDMEKTLLSLSHQNFWMRNCYENVVQEFGLDGYESWIDRKAGTCDFEDESFLALLRILKRFAPDLDTVEANNDGKNPLFKTWYTQQSARSGGLMYFAEAFKSGKPYSEYGMQGKMIPVPGKSGVDGVSIEPFGLLSVMKDAANPQGVKELLSYLYSEEVQRPVIEELNTGTFSPVMAIQNAYTTWCLENPSEGMAEDYKPYYPQSIAEIR